MGSPDISLKFTPPASYLQWRWQEWEDKVGSFKNGPTFLPYAYKFGDSWTLNPGVHYRLSLEGSGHRTLISWWRGESADPQEWHVACWEIVNPVHRWVLTMVFCAFFHPALFLISSRMGELIKMRNAVGFPNVAPMPLYCKNCYQLCPEICIWESNVEIWGDGWFDFYSDGKMS